MKNEAKARGGYARAKALTAKRRREIAKNAVESRWAKNLPLALHVGEVDVGGMKIGCAVLEDRRRVLTQSDMMRAMGRARQAKGRGYYDSDVNLPAFLTAKNLKPFISNELNVTSSQIEFRLPSGQRAFGYEAAMLPQVCEVYLKARDAGALVRMQQHIARQADILIRGLANVGIVALVDEATGYQRERAANTLALILEKFIAKELQPWVKTFPDTFYEELFRLRGKEYPKDTVKRPLYFGILTNDIIYSRLAPGVLKELKESTPKSPTGRLKHRLFQRLSSELGHPKLREHMASVIAIMKLSKDYPDFMGKLDRLHPSYRSIEQLELFGQEEPYGL